MSTETKEESTTTTTTTTTENPDDDDGNDDNPSLWDRITQHRRLILILLLLLLIGYLFLSPFRADRPISITKETIENENIRASVQREDIERAGKLRQIAAMLEDNSPDIHLRNTEVLFIRNYAAQDFGRGFFPQGVNITVERIFIQSPGTERVEIDYRMDGDFISMKISRLGIIKTLSTQGGIRRGGSLWDLFRWYGWERVTIGNTVYEYNQPMRDGQPEGDPTITKTVIKARPFRRIPEWIGRLLRVLHIVRENLTEE